MKIRPHGSFFTLIEVIVTMLIMTVISALIIGSFHTGLMCYRKSIVYEAPVLQLNGALSLIRDDLRRFVPINAKAVKFTNDEMSFVAVSTIPRTHLELISYTVKNKCMERNTATYPEAGFSRTGPSVLIEDLDKWAFSYVRGDIPIDTKKIEGVSSGEKEIRKEECWPVMIMFNGKLTGERSIQTSMLIPVFDVPDIAEKKNTR